ncbi:unnamed protein product [Anisakis simplex]|uniref:EGF-like domain-containing protein n=1 Tax=Anisakis simplex TaxID=6269 RepID=A0A0M3KE30_ANISI|nr:unnamed protein product [Anisakis simplex]
MESCVEAKIHRNHFINNNEHTKSGTVALEMSPHQHSKVFHVDIAENVWMHNKGAWCLYIIPNNDNPLNGSVHDNKFERNENQRGSVIVGSSQFRINDNEFDNRLEKFDLEIEFLQSNALDATNNYWGDQENSESIEKRILDGRIDHSRGIAYIDPIGRKRSPAPIADDCEVTTNCTTNAHCIEPNECECDHGFGGANCSEKLNDCSSLNDCSTNGNCVAPNHCKCYEGWYGDDCSTPSCELLSNCSAHGQCVSLNECLCDPLYQGDLLDSISIPRYKFELLTSTITFSLPLNLAVLLNLVRAKFRSLTAWDVFSCLFSSQSE